MAPEARHATHTFDLPAHGGATLRAADLARVTVSNLQDEVADVVRTADLLERGPVTE